MIVPTTIHSLSFQLLFQLVRLAISRFACMMTWWRDTLICILRQCVLKLRWVSFYLKSIKLLLKAQLLLLLSISLFLLSVLSIWLNLDIDFCWFWWIVIIFDICNSIFTEFYCVLKILNAVLSERGWIKSVFAIDQTSIQ
jgi:hypothetical protein